MNGWIEYHLALWNHWKINRLKVILKIRYAEALGIVSCLWTWAGNNSPKGDLSRFTDDEIDDAARWEGDKKVLRLALKEAKLLDKNDKLHDWNKHGLKLIISSRKRQKEYRRKLRNNNIDVTATSPSIIPLSHTSLTKPNQHINTPLTPKELQVKELLTKTEPLNRLKDADRFSRRVCSSYELDFILCEIKKIPGWLATHPSRESEIRNWEKFIGGWLKRGAGDSYGLKKLGEVLDVGKKITHVKSDPLEGKIVAFRGLKQAIKEE